MIRKCVVLFFLGLVLVGCSAVPQAPTTKTADPAKAKSYYWVSGNISNPFYVQGLAGWNAAAKDLGVKAQLVGPAEPNVQEILKTFEELVAKPDTGGILLYPLDWNALEPIIKEAQAKGIPVVIGNSDSPFKTRAGFVGTDNVQMANAAAALAAKAIDCKGSVGTIGNKFPPLPTRMETFGAKVKELCPAVKVYEMGLYDGSALGAAATLDAYTVAHPDLSLVWFADGASGQTVGPWKEKQQAGLKTLFLGTDIPAAALDAVKEGAWYGTMGQDTYAEEYWGLTFLVARQSGTTIPDTVYNAAMIVTRDNVDQYIKK